MPLPFEYQNASRQFEQFMLDARDLAGLATTNMSWNMVVGVLRVFRCRVTPQQALRFADALPPVLRALFVADWDLAQPLRDFGSAQTLLDEVRSVRRQHNFSPPHAIEAVAGALRRHTDPEALARALAELPSAAQAYWLGPHAKPD